MRDRDRVVTYLIYVAIGIAAFLLEPTWWTLAAGAVCLLLERWRTGRLELLAHSAEGWRTAAYVVVDLLASVSHAAFSTATGIAARLVLDLLL